MFSPRSGTEWRLANFKSTGGHREFAAANPPAGIAIDYYTKDRGPVRITIADKSGKTIRTINAQAEAGTVNQTVWNLQLDNPLQGILGGGFGRGGGGGGAGAPRGGAAGRGARGGAAGPGAGAATAGTTPEPGGEAQTEAGGAAAGGAGFAGGRGGRGGAGMEVDPGEYVITVSQNGKSDQKTVSVADDPRLTFSAEDRTKRKAAMDRVISMVKDADTGRRKILAMQNGLNSLLESWKRPNAPAIPDSVKKAAEDLLAKVKTAAAAFEAPPAEDGVIRELGGAGAQPPYTPPPVLQKITRVMMTLSYPGAPLDRQLKDLEECGTELKSGLATVDALNAEVPKLNKLMQDAGVVYFTIDPSSVPPPATGRGGGER